MTMKKSVISIALPAAICSLTVAATPAPQQNKDNPYLETITIIGSREQAQNIAGSVVVN